MSRSPRRGDAAQVAWQVVQEATGQAEPAQTRPKDAAAVARGRAGGQARAKNMSSDERVRAAIRARAARSERQVAEIEQQDSRVAG
jgi:hypothetical protein